MSEKLQNQSTQPKQSRFDQFKSWLKESQTENANRNIEIAATGQTPLKRALAKIEGFVNGDSEASDQLNQEMIDYRYETARLQRKAEREAKGQSFEQAVQEDIAKKELAKKQNVEVTAVSPVDSVAETSTFPSIQIDRKPKSANSTFDRIKAWGALAVLSGSMMLAPNALANNNNSKIENNNPTKIEQVKTNDKTTNEKTANSEQTNEQQVKQIEQLIEGKGVNNGGIKAGLSIKGLEARFQARAKHNGESQAKIQFTVKGQVESAKQLIRQGQSETVAYILTSLESDNAKAQKATDEGKKQLSDERIYKDAIAGLKTKSENKIKVNSNQKVTKTCDKLIKAPSIARNKNEKISKSDSLKPVNITIESANYPYAHGEAKLSARTGTIGDMAILFKYNPSDTKIYMILDAKGYNLSDNFFNKFSKDEKKVLVPFDIPDSKKIETLSFESISIRTKDLKIKTEDIFQKDGVVVKMYFLEITKPKDDCSSPEAYLKQVENLMSILTQTRSFDFYNNSTRMDIDLFNEQLKISKPKFPSEAIINLL
jgi:hypothetical protein